MARARPLDLAAEDREERRHRLAAAHHAVGARAHRGRAMLVERGVADASPRRTHRSAPRSRAPPARRAPGLRSRAARAGRRRARSPTSPRRSCARPCGTPRRPPICRARRRGSPTPAGAAHPRPRPRARSRARAPPRATARRTSARARGPRRLGDEPALGIAQRLVVVGLDEPDELAAIDERHEQRCASRAERLELRAQRAEPHRREVDRPRARRRARTSHVARSRDRAGARPCARAARRCPIDVLPQRSSAARRSSPRRRATRRA